MAMQYLGKTEKEEGEVELFYILNKEFRYITKIR